MSLHDTPHCWQRGSGVVPDWVSVQMEGRAQEAHWCPLFLRSAICNPGLVAFSQHANPSLSDTPRADRQKHTGADVNLH